MIAVRAALACLALLPLAAAGQDPTPVPVETTAPRQRAAPPEWDLGAGVGWTVVSLGSSGLTSVFGVTAPSVTASLERALAPRTWLVLGLEGQWTHSTSDAPAASGEADRRDVTFAAVSIGVRQVVTAPGAPVDVSFVVTADGGLADVSNHVPQPAIGSPSDARAWALGVSGGLAIDRELTPGLALRVASPLVAASFGETRFRSPGAPAVRTKDASVGVMIAPSLELRVAF